MVNPLSARDGRGVAAADRLDGADRRLDENENQSHYHLTIAGDAGPCPSSFDQGEVTMIDCSRVPMRFRRRAPSRARIALLFASCSVGRRARRRSAGAATAGDPRRGKQRRPSISPGQRDDGDEDRHAAEGDPRVDHRRAGAAHQGRVAAQHGRPAALRARRDDAPGRGQSRRRRAARQPHQRRLLHQRHPRRRAGVPRRLQPRAARGAQGTGRRDLRSRRRRRRDQPRHEAAGLRAGRRGVAAGRLVQPGARDVRRGQPDQRHGRVAHQRASASVPTAIATASISTATRSIRR